MPQSKRFVAIAEYQRLTGLSYATVKHMINSNQLKTITTESGLVRIDIHDDNADSSAIVKRLDEQERMLKALCGHLGVR